VTRRRPGDERPQRCGRCGGSAFRWFGERLDTIDDVIVGFGDCLHCGAQYVYKRAPTAGDALGDPS
jgi:predicted PP-loop superfamily ATPase